MRDEFVVQWAHALHLVEYRLHAFHVIRQ